MNYQDKSSYPGLDTLRGERAPVDLHAKIVSSLLPGQRSNRNAKWLKLSLAAAVALSLVTLSLLAPRMTFAASIKRILRAFQSIHQYHIRSFKVVEGHRQLISETWVNGANRRVQAYDTDGNPIRDMAGFADMAAKLDKQMHEMTPEQLLDPGLKDKLNKEIAPLGPNAGFISERITIDGQVVSDLPEAAKQAIREHKFLETPMVSIGGQEDLTYMLGLLKRPDIWEVESNQTANGKTVNRYRISRSDNRLLLSVDPRTSLPVEIQMNDLGGIGATVIDEIDYPEAGP